MINPRRRDDYRDRDYARKDTPAPAPKARTTPVSVLPAPKTVFEKYERVMQDSFRSLCEAVAEIKNKHLYRQAGYDSFEECCQERWGWTKQRGYQLADANATLKSLPQKVNRLLTNEAQTRAVAALPKENRVEVIKTVARSGPVTAPRITAQARSIGIIKSPKVIDVEPEPAEKHCPTCGQIWEDRKP